jgi:hypothetical protein
VYRLLDLIAYRATFVEKFSHRSFCRFSGALLAQLCKIDRWQLGVSEFIACQDGSLANPVPIFRFK